MEELAEQLKKVLADTMSMYQKAHQFHWNVEGPDFYQYHQLFQRIYEEVYGAVDSIGEHIRALDSYAPFGYGRLAELTSIMDAPANPPAMVMIRSLFTDNEKVMATIMEAYRLAEKYNEIGLSNFLQDRYDSHKLHQYMLRSTLKGQEQ